MNKFEQIMDGAALTTAAHVLLAAREGDATQGPVHEAALALLRAGTAVTMGDITTVARVQVREASIILRKRVSRLLPTLLADPRKAERAGKTVGTIVAQLEVIWNSMEEGNQRHQPEYAALPGTVAKLAVLIEN